MTMAVKLFGMSVLRLPEDGARRFPSKVLSAVCCTLLRFLYFFTKRNIFGASLTHNIRQSKVHIFEPHHVILSGHVVFDILLRRQSMRKSMVIGDRHVQALLLVGQQQQNSHPRQQWSY